MRGDVRRYRRGRAGRRPLAAVLQPDRCGPGDADRAATGPADPRPGPDDHAVAQRREVRGDRHGLPDEGRLRDPDYVHVWDLARAHVAALARFDELLPGPGGSLAINLGTGTGTTVWELLAAFNSCVSQPLAAVETARRPGDVAGVYARCDRAEQWLGWRPTYSIAEGITHSLEWAGRRDRILSPRSAEQ